MGSVTHPRGRLPKRVYWVRRSVVLVLALLLVFGIGKLLGGTGEDEAASSIKASTTVTKQPDPSVTLGPVAPTAKLRALAQAPPPSPSGECGDNEVSVQPSVAQAWAGKSIVIQLQFSGTQPACTFEVSAESLQIKITSGEEEIWLSKDCPQQVPTTQVVVRSGEPSTVPVVWSGRRSDADCTNQPAWAMPGFYHVQAAALGSAATDVQFEITRAPTVTTTASPRPSASASDRVSATPRPVATPRPSATP